MRIAVAYEVVEKQRLEKLLGGDRVCAYVLFHEFGNLFVTQGFVLEVRAVRIARKPCNLREVFLVYPGSVIAYVETLGEVSEFPAREPEQGGFGDIQLEDLPCHLHGDVLVRGHVGE